MRFSYGYSTLMDKLEENRPPVRALPVCHAIILSVELVEEIIRSVALLPDSDASHLALLRLALSCHQLSIVALGELWRRFQHSLLPLIEILGAGNFVRYCGIGVCFLMPYHAQVH